MKSYTIMIACLIVLTVFTQVDNKFIWGKSINLKTDDSVETPSNSICLNYLPYNIWNNPQGDYYNWYGLYGKSINGTTFLTGHVFDRHLAVNGACTLQQKQ